MGRVVCVFGTASDVGKSVTAAAVARMLKRKGLSVAPFKAQNMSNNAGVVRISTSPEDDAAMGEIGRAQVVQAEACGVGPETDMNPVLLKPSSDRASQVVLHGRALGEAEASELWRRGGSAQSPLRAAAFASLRRLVRKYDVVVVEGAGSCAEVNLRDRDYVNFDIAHEAARVAAEDGTQPPAVLVVADIEKGGVFAQVVGSLVCMPPRDRALVSGILVNKFRGDASLFDDGVTWLEKETGVPVLGVIPYFDPLDVAGDGSRWVLDAEDGLYASARVDPCELKSAVMRDGDGDGRGVVRIAVVLLPRIANHTDFAPLQAHPDVVLDFLRTPRDLGVYDVVILPGSKSVIADLRWLRRVGWVPHVAAYTHRPQGTLLGVCGGYQMLGVTLHDPDGRDGAAVACEDGLRLLPTTTTMADTKTLCRVDNALWAAPGHTLLPEGTAMSGYEIHAGVTETVANWGNGDADDVVVTDVLRGCSDGAARGSAANGRTWTRPSTGTHIVGTYLHGLFDGTNAERLVACVTATSYREPAAPAAGAGTDGRFDALAVHYENAMASPAGTAFFKALAEGNPVAALGSGF